MYRSLRFLLPILAICALAFPARAQYVVKQSTAYTFTLPDIIDASNHINGLTAQTGTVYLTRVTGSSGAITKAASTNNISEVDSVNAPGQYTLTLTSSETSALGWIKGYYKSASSDPVSFTIKVVAYNPDDASLLGLTGVGTLSNQSTILAKTNLIGTNGADSPNEQTAQTTISTNLNATVSSRSTYAGGDTSGTTTLLTRLGTPVGASISADIQTRSTYAGTDTSGVTTLLSRLGTPAGASIAADIAALSTKLGTPAGASFSADIAGIPAGVWNNGMRTLSATADSAGITTLLGRIAGNLTLTNGGVTVAAYASGQDPATLVLGATVDSGNGLTLTLKQAAFLSFVSAVGKFGTPVRSSSAPWTITVPFLRLDGTTTGWTYVTPYTDNTFTKVAGPRTFTPGTLP